MINAPDQERLDRATAERLVALADRSVDTSALHRRLEEAIRGSVADETADLRMPGRRWWRPVLSAAAAVVAVVAIGWIVMVGASPRAIAAPAAMAQIHHAVTSGLSPQFRVSTVEEANRVLAAQAEGITPIPLLPGELRSCCLHQLAGATLTCALIERDGRLISITVADGGALRSPKGRTVTRNGGTFIVHTADGVNMVMSHTGDKWMCVMGDASAEELLDVATGITP